MEKLRVSRSTVVHWHDENAPRRQEIVGRLAELDVHTLIGSCHPVSAKGQERARARLFTAAEDGAAPRLLLARSSHASIRSLERYGRPGPEAATRSVAKPIRAAGADRDVVGDGVGVRRGDCRLPEWAVPRNSR